MITQHDFAVETTGSLITGTGGDDTLDGGLGNDTIYGLGGNDRIEDSSGGDNLIFGGDGNDFVILGGNGSNLVDGGAGNDSIFSGGGADSLLGGDGSDSIMGGGGDDTIEGGAGDDFMWGNTDTREFPSHDTLSYAHAEAAISFDLADTAPQDTGGAGIDGAIGFADLTGSGFSDHLGGDQAANLIHGGFGDDQINGAGGADSLYGDQGADTIRGGGGNDTIDGGEGQDQLSGGGGHDLFVFDSIFDTWAGQGDQIRDLTDDDRIDLSQIDANPFKAGDQAFHIVKAFTDHAGQMTVTYDADSHLTQVLMDTNGDGMADGEIDLSGDHHDFTGFSL